MSLHYTHEITGGVLLSPRGEVHRRQETRTSCALTIPARHATVSTVQAVVHKIPLCHACFPAHHRDGGRRG